MKTILASFLLIFATLATLSAQAPRILIVTDKDNFSGFMIAADQNEFLWRESQQSTVTRKQRFSTCTVYFIEAPELTEAIELYKSRKYQEASEKFAAVAQLYSKVQAARGNPSTLASFYQMECARRLEDLETLASLAGKFKPEPLIHEFHRLQYEIYNVFWDAVRTKSWSRLDAIVNDEKWRSRVLPGNLRAQIAYAHGLALEGMEKPIPALNAYNHAFVADFAASEEITQKSALNSLRIILDHQDVKTAMRLYPTEDYSDDSNGAFLIKEGTALLKLWDKVLGAGEKIPAKYQVLLKFPPKNKQN